MVDKIPWKKCKLKKKVVKKCIYSQTKLSIVKIGVHGVHVRSAFATEMLSFSIVCKVMFSV